jgi:hypothetical protein
MHNMSDPPRRGSGGGGWPLRQLWVGSPQASIRSVTCPGYMSSQKRGYRGGRGGRGGRREVGKVGEQVCLRAALRAAWFRLCRGLKGDVHETEKTHDTAQS